MVLAVPTAMQGVWGFAEDSAPVSAELVIAWLIVGIAASVVTAIVCLLVGYAIFGRRV
ncbi:MAG: hypothetical protein WEB59_05545 [Thermoanaerobaculia bacterium]